MSLRKKLPELGINIPPYINNMSLQLQLAPVLREMAIHNLKSGNGAVARGFRGEAGGTGINASKFLSAQAQSGTWGTYIEAASLAEILGCHLVVTAVTTKNGHEERKTFSLYRAEDDNAPVIKLNNINNNHWTDENGDAIGDGNCLYNAFALALRAHTQPSQIKDEPQKKAATSTTTNINSSSSSNSLTNTNLEIKITAQQQEIFNRYISKLDKPSEAEKKVKAEEERIAKLSVEEKQQITSDRALAFDMVLNPYKY